VLIRIIKSLPAPLMDGFDVRRFRINLVYDVDHRVGRYLIVAGYAESLDEAVSDRPKPQKSR
jgi:hypothetical protein